MRIKRKWKFPAVIVAVFSMLSPEFAQQATPQSKFSVAISRESIFAGAVGPARPWPSWQRWDSRFLIAIDADASPTRPAVTVFDRDGKIVREAIVWFAEASVVNVGDAALTESGQLLVSAGAVKSDGTVANVIAAFDAGGKMTQVLRTSPFVPLRICSVANGSIWAYGWDRRNTRTNRYPVLREFSFEGGLLDSLVDGNTLPRDFATGGRWHDDVGLRCNNNTVALYLGSAGELIEHDVRKPDSLVRWKLPAVPEKMRVTGYALTNSGDFFASVKNEGERDKVTAGIFHLEKGTAPNTRWVGVENSAMQRTRHEYRDLTVLGVDGNALVHISDPMEGLVGWSEIGPKP